MMTTSKKKAGGDQTAEEAFPEGALAVVVFDSKSRQDLHGRIEYQIPCKVVGAISSNKNPKEKEVEVVVAMAEKVKSKDGSPQWTMGAMVNKKAKELAVLHTCVPKGHAHKKGERVEWQFEELEVDISSIDTLEDAWKSMLPGAPNSTEPNADSPETFTLEAVCEKIFGKDTFTPRTAWSAWLRVALNHFWSGRPDAIVCNRLDMVQENAQGQTLVVDLDGGEGAAERARLQELGLKQARQRLTKVMLQRNSPLTSVLNDREINQIVSKCTILTVEDGHELVHQGVVGTETYFVIAGELEAIVEYGEGENALSQVVEVLVAGNTFGEVSLRNQESPCTVRAKGHGELAVGALRMVEMVVNQSQEAVRALEQIVKNEHKPVHELLMKREALLLQLLTDREIKALAKLFEVRPILHDEMLYQEGDSGDSMFLAIRGCARVFNTLPARGGGDHRHQIAVLTPGELIEECCVLLDRPRASSVLVLAGSVIGEVKKEDAAAVLAASKAAEQYAKRIEGCTSLTYVTEACMRDDVSAFFPKLSAEEQRSIALGAEQIQCDKGFEVVKAGKTSTAIYFVLEGELEVLVAGDTPTGFRHAGKLPVGHTVGEISMVSSARATATVLASQPSNLIKISLDAAEPAILSRPDLVDFIHHLKRIFLERRELMELLAQNIDAIMEVYNREENGDERGHAVVNKDPPFFSRWVMDETVEVVEISPPLFGHCPSDRGRYERSEGVLSEGPFKRIYRAFDSEWKMEVAWNVVLLHKMPTSTRMQFLSEVNTIVQLTNQQPTWLRYTLVEDKHGNLRMKNKWELSQANPVKEMVEQFTPRSVPIGEAFGTTGLPEQDFEQLTGQQAWRALNPWEQEKPTDWDEAIPDKYLSAQQREERQNRARQSRVFASPSIIKCYNMWEDEATRTMVFITELIHPTRGSGPARRAFTCLQLGSYQAKAPFVPS